jgi:hypothetical protein
LSMKSRRLNSVMPWFLTRGRYFRGRI